METSYTYQPGMTVYGSDGDKVGTVLDVFGDYLVVEKGFFFPKDYYIPTAAIASSAGDDLYLTVTKDEALHQGWDAMPETPIASTPVESFAPEAGVAASASEIIAPDYTAATDATAATSGEAVRMPVYEEEIVPVKREVDRGAVRIEKETVTEERTVTVPVTEERIRVTRVASDESAPGDVFSDTDDQVIEVPLRGEEVEVQTLARKTGEVIVEKEAMAREEQVGGQVRREEIRVNDRTIPSDPTLEGTDVPR